LKQLKLFLRIGVFDVNVPHGGKDDRMMQACFQAISPDPRTLSGVLALQIGVAGLVLWHGSRKNHRRCVLWFRIAL